MEKVFTEEKMMKKYINGLSLAKRSSSLTFISRNYQAEQFSGIL